MPPNQESTSQALTNFTIFVHNIIIFTLDQPDSQSTMLISLTVGKVDAGVAVLLTEDKRLV